MIVFTITFILSFTLLRGLGDLGVHRDAKNMYKKLPYLKFVETPFDKNEIYGFEESNSSIYPDLTYRFDETNINFRNGEWIMHGIGMWSPITLYWKYKYKKWFSDNLHKIETETYREFHEKRNNERTSNRSWY